MATPEKQVVVIGIDDSDHSFYALEWALDHFFAPYAPNFPFSLVIVHAKPSPASAIGLAGPGNCFLSSSRSVFLYVRVPCSELVVLAMLIAS